MEKPDTRQKILDAAVELFSLRGFTDVSIRDLADAVGIKSASLYYHFANKDEILATILDTYRVRLFKLLNFPDIEAVHEWQNGKSFEEVVEELYRLPTAQDVESIRNMTRISIREQFNYPQTMRFWGERAIGEMVSKLKCILDAMTEDGRLPKMDTLMAAEITVRSLITYLIQFAHFYTSQDSDSQSSIHNTMQYLFARIREGDF